MVKQPQHGGNLILSVLRSYGVEAIFSSPGSEWAPLWDAVAEASAEGTGPAFYNIRHEELAVSMAAGYYRKTGRLPAVALHCTVGTLKAAMALRVARHERIPMVVLAGESIAFDEQPGPPMGSQWQRSLGEIGGPAALAVPYVKRAVRVTAPELVAGMLHDACRAALAPPCGPVLLSIPLEYMLPAASMVSPSGGAVWRTRPDTAQLNEVARLLCEAQRPVLVTEAAGSRPENVARLVALAESLAIPVVDGPSPAYVNLPSNHPLHLGYHTGPLLNGADLVLVVAGVMPWYPASARPASVQYVILVDDYPTYDLMPYWGYAVDRTLGGDLSAALDGLTDRIGAFLATNPEAVAAVAQRREEWASIHLRQRMDWASELAPLQDGWPVDSRWLCHQMAAVLPPDAIFVDETTTDKVNVVQYGQRIQPGTFQGRMTGGLGVGLGTALGLKLAAPHQEVAALVGDGAFHYNPVVAALGFAQEYGVPFLTVVFNNGHYAAMKQTHLRYYPQGWGAQTGYLAGSPIAPDPDYAGLAQAYGGWGGRVTGPDDLKPKLQEALERLRAGQFALLDVPTQPGVRSVPKALPTGMR